MNGIKLLPPEINIVRYNELDVLEISHPKCCAKIALQGAHLFSWQPSHAKQDVLWISEIEPFKAGNAIRGGIPVCYPNFGNGLDGKQKPSHGYARISSWDLSSYRIEPHAVYITLQLAQQAKIEMILGEQATLHFTKLDSEPSQLALHSYFNIADITQTKVSGLPTRCFDKLTQHEQAVESPRKIAENIDCIYTLQQPISVIDDNANQRQIEVEHINASEIVLWNPWHQPTNGMSETGYKTMVCVETARIYRLLSQNETVGVKICVK